MKDGGKKWKVCSELLYLLSSHTYLAATDIHLTLNTQPTSNIRCVLLKERNLFISSNNISFFHERLEFASANLKQGNDSGSYIKLHKNKLVFITGQRSKQYIKICLKRHNHDPDKGKRWIMSES